MSDIIDERYIAQLQAYADLAEEYVSITRVAQAQMGYLEERQEQVLTPILGDHFEYQKIWNEDDYRQKLQFSDFREQVYDDFINNCVAYINKRYDISFDISSEEGKELMEEFEESGANVDSILALLEMYLDGKSFSTLRAEEATLAVYDMVRPQYYEPGKLRFNIASNGVTVIFPNFVYADYDNRRISHATVSRLAMLKNYFVDALGYNIGWGPIDADFGSQFVTPDTLMSRVKSVAVFKNGNMKVTFSDPEAVDCFVSPLRKLAGTK